jgi:hypothetical protein
MKKVILSFCILMLSSILAFAQVSDDYKKAEFSVGYSNNQVDTGISDGNNDLRNIFNDRESFNGFEVSAVGNVSRYVGIKGDISGHYKSYNFNVRRPGLPAVTDEFNVDASLYNFLAGVQVKDNAVDGSRLRPFAHGLAGVARANAKVDSSFFNSPFCQQPGVNCQQDFSSAETGFAAVIGGGLDIKANNRISIRAIQVDYNPIRINSNTSHNFRFGVGLVFH